MRNRLMGGDLVESPIQGHGPVVEERISLEPSATSSSVDLEIASDDRVITLSLTAQDARQLIFSLHRAVHDHYCEQARAARWQRQQHAQCAQRKRPDVSQQGGGDGHG